MKKLITLTAMLCVSAFAFAQYSHVAVGPNGNKTEEGQYNADPGIQAGDSKEIVANKMAAVHKIGVWKYWYENGQLSAEEHYDNAGIAIGTWKSFNPDGKTSMEWDRTNGNTLFYHPNGEKAEAGVTNASNMRVGNWDGWYDTGVLNYTGSYNNAGMKNGTWKYYDAAGTLIATEVYSNGVKTN